MTRSRTAFRSLPILLAAAATLPAHAQNTPQVTPGQPSTVAPAAPASSGSLHGLVADPSGAVIPGAIISVTDTQGHTLATGTSGQDGSYAIANIPPGTYVVLFTAQGFGPLSTRSVTVASRGNKLLNAALVIEVAQQQVQVTSDTPTVSVDPDANANSITISGKDLDALSDDPDELSNELTALAGPAAGPSGGQVYIDGFTGGQLPPKSAIREIRINQNPYGAQFDKLGFGRIEVFTKPGTDKWHGQFYSQGNARQLNTGTPFTKTIPDYDTFQYEGTISGPITKNASFYVTAQHRNIGDANIISAYRLQGEINGDFAAGDFTNTADYDVAPYSDSLGNPQSRTNIAPRLDLQLGSKNTLTARYQYERNAQTNEGVGQFALPSQAYNTTSSENTIQISDTEVFGPRVIMEWKFQSLFDRSTQSPSSTLPTVQVQGNETFGGFSSQTISDHTDHYEVDNLTELALGKHSISFGGRFRATREANDSNGSFNGLYTFAARSCSTTTGCPVGGATNPCQSGTATSAGCQEIAASQTYALTLQGQGTGQTFAQIQAAGGGPSQLVYVTGSPKADVNLEDGALFYQDDWKYRPNLTLSYGLRWETQNHISDHSDWAPRLAANYGIMRHGKPTKDVIRAGFGYFYDRFAIAQVLQAARVNGIVQQEAVIQNPTCYLPNGLPGTAAAITAACGAASSAVTTSGNSSVSNAIYQVGPNLHAPANIQESIGLDHQLTRTSTLSLTYIHSHGAHALDTINANAPYAPGYNAALGNVYQYFSEGVYNQNQLFLNGRVQINRSLSMFGFYGLSYARGDVNGITSNPSNSLDLKQDYGRTSNDVRNRLFIMGSYSAPHLVRVSPFIVAQSGAPFNITVSQDQNGDSLFTDRPAFAAAGSTGANIVTNSYGTFNTAPTTGTALIPINYGNGPTLFTLNLRLSKTWGFGQKLQKAANPNQGGGQPGGGPPPGGRGGGGGGGGRGGPGGGGGMFGDNGSSGRRYNFTLNAQALNLLNIVNYAPPTGTIDSPLFGRSNQLAGQIFSSPDGAAARRIFLQATFAF
ncbi:TonB-dependent receptor [Acidipila sp. EB88]|uniref:TonB-dependent receptor n=1 Tax=Acidipila sp. EB88 TaxID=2305226 RepID=UPI000F60122B|nr:TonB-dependent receptor [Acidipila sp. EB88]RRA47533.1 carboxypeptidase regulatory-like domain-containing protein [Acidipila sp. EB88]